MIKMIEYATPVRKLYGQELTKHKIHAMRCAATWVLACQRKKKCRGREQRRSRKGRNTRD